MRAEADRPPDDFPAELLSTLPDVVTVLQRIADARSAPAVTAVATARAMADYPLRPHLETAKELEHWLLHGTGTKKQPKDVVGYYRNQLRLNAKDVPAATRANGRAGTSHYDRVIRSGA